jgi:hypothetical protein
MFYENFHTAFELVQEFMRESVEPTSPFSLGDAHAQIIPLPVEYIN